MMALRSTVLAPAVAGVLLLAAIRAAAAEDVVEMSFEGFGPAGIHLMTTHTVIEEDPAWYRISGDFATAGLGALFVSVANRSVAQGRQADDAPHPVNFASETARDGVVQHLRVDYGSDGMPEGSATPPPREPVTPVAVGQLAGTVDNLTAYLKLEHQVARGGGCALTVPVFDGRHRYDLKFSDGGKPVLSPEDGQKFAGPTQACRMVRDELGGFYVDKKHEEGAHSGTIWYATQLMPGDIAVPVRMKMDTEIGDVAVLLARLKGRGVDLRLME
jgi:Protein of unknown function (DUF3108)